MPTHWTYAPVGPEDDLEQGDILRPTAELREVFATVHPHFGDGKYLGFIVQTQSCDLVRRAGGPPNALYINVATIRPLSQVLHKLASQVTEEVAPGVFRSSERSRVHQLLQRLLNQNEQAQGLFFLYPDADAGIAEPAVAFLRVAIALRREHYQLLVQARVGRLGAEFRAKFGWLAGNLFARPASSDWSDHAGGATRLKELTRQLLGEIRWVDDEVLQAAISRQVDIATTTDQELEALRGPTPLEKAVGEVERELRRVVPDVGDELVQKLGNRLRNNGKFMKATTVASERVPTE